MLMLLEHQLKPRTVHKEVHHTSLYRNYNCDWKCVLTLFSCVCQSGFSARYAPGKTCQIIMACVVLHNITVKLRLPVPDDDGEDPADDDNNDDSEDPADDDNNDDGEDPADDDNNDDDEDPADDDNNDDGEDPADDDNNDDGEEPSSSGTGSLNLTVMLCSTMHAMMI